MHKFKLKNGLTVIWEPRRSETVAIEICVGTGSNNEPRDIAGMSHFIEHMLFEGTSTRSAKDISRAIEDVGGELNAATSNDMTYYYAKVPKSKFELGLEILADITKHALIKNDDLEKERKVILEEIKMVNDQPLLYQWVLFEKNIFRIHPTKNPVYGRVDSVQAITRDQMVDYFNAWYCPNNMIISVVGRPRRLLPLIKQHFEDIKPRELPKVHKVVEPKQLRSKLVKEVKKTNQAYLVLGFKTVPRTHRDSYVLDVIAAIFSKGLSGRINEEIRVKRGLAYSVGTVNESKKDYGFIAIHLNCGRKNLELCKKLILNEIRNLDTLGGHELKAAKDYIIGKMIIEEENAEKRAEELAFWQFINSAKLAYEYKNKIRRVRKRDVLRVRNRYLSRNHTMVLISK
jgi:predicted Zn-dependent peptidase